MRRQFGNQQATEDKLLMSQNFSYEFLIGILALFSRSEPLHLRNPQLDSQGRSDDGRDSGDYT
jgi:hypothetical protein